MAFQVFRQDIKKWWNVHPPRSDSYIRTKRKERKARVLVLIIFRKGPGVLAAWPWHFRNFAKTTKSGEMFFHNHTFVRKERKARVLVLLFLGKVRVSWQPGHGISGISLRQQKVVKCSPRSDSYEREARVPSLLELFTKTKRWWNVDPQIQYERKARVF